MTIGTAADGPFVHRGERKTSSIATTCGMPGLAGTSTLLVRRFDGFSWAVLFNTDKSSNGKRLSGLIDPLMHEAVREVSHWPDEIQLDDSLN